MKRLLAVICLLLVVALVELVAVQVRSAERAELEARGATGGDPERGRDAIAFHGCGSCHVIEGVPGAHSTVAPPLDDFAQRATIAGRLPNTTHNLIEFVRFPQRIDPGIAMPNMEISEPDARDIAAYLYSNR